jgi:uncharacterized Zn-binding protein involved in type VI secretion
MSKQIVRVGDIDNGGGRVLSGDETLRVNGIAVAIDGSPVSAHPHSRGDNKHDHAVCRASQSTIRVNGKPIIFVGDVDTCGHTRIQGSPDAGGL